MHAMRISRFFLQNKALKVGRFFILMIRIWWASCAHNRGRDGLAIKDVQEYDCLNLKSFANTVGYLNLIWPTKRLKFVMECFLTEYFIGCPVGIGVIGEKWFCIYQVKTEIIGMASLSQ
jgi:hypothetical protein